MGQTKTMDDLLAAIPRIVQILEDYRFYMKDERCVSRAEEAEVDAEVDPLIQILEAVKG